MKKILFLLAVMLIAVSCFAQVDTVHYIDSATLAWSAVTTDSEGEPLLDTDVVTYDVYLYNAADTLDDQNPAEISLVGNTADLEMPIDFTGMARAMYYAGVRVVVEDGQGTVTASDIAWSYDPVATDPIQPFAYIPLGGVLVLPAPTGLREAGM